MTKGTVKRTVKGLQPDKHNDYNIYTTYHLAHILYPFLLLLSAARNCYFTTFNLPVLKHSSCKLTSNCMSLLQYPCRVQKQKPFILRLTAELNCIQQDYLYHLPPCSLSSNCFLLPPVTLACLTTCSAIKQNMFLEHLYVKQYEVGANLLGGK